MIPILLKNGKLRVPWFHESEGVHADGYEDLEPGDPYRKEWEAWLAAKGIEPRLEDELDR